MATLLVAFVLCIKGVREPDIWWQIRTGEWILENKTIPSQDVFSYTYEGASWVNVKWGSEVLFALIQYTLGAEFIFLLQAIVVLCMVFFLYKTALLFHSSNNQSSTIVYWLSMLLFLIGAEYRFIGRPEMFSHLLTTIFVYVLFKYRTTQTNALFILIPLQIAWANLHEAFGIGLVITAVFTVGEWIQYYLHKKNILHGNSSKPIKLTALLPLLILSTIINPYGYKLLTKPFDILGQVYENKYTTELLGFTSPDYWQWNVYWAIALLVLAKAGWLLHYYSTKSKQHKLLLTVQHFGVSYIILLLAFFYLAGTAYRNILFFSIVLFPVTATGFQFLLSRFTWITQHSRQFYITISFAIALYILIVSNAYYRITDSRDRFGLTVRTSFNPIDAAQYVKNNIPEGRCFSDYLTSSYLLWKLQPDFKTFIDLRDLDVFPGEFFNYFAEAVTFPESFQSADSAYAFNYVVLYRPQFQSLHKYLYQSKQYRLAYVDEVAAVYIKTDSSLNTETFSGVSVNTQSGLAAIVNHVLNPLYKVEEDIDHALFASSYYSTVGNLPLAEQYALQSANGSIEPYKGKAQLADVYYNMALQQTDMNQRNALFQNAQAYYLQALDENKYYAVAHLGLGAIYFQQQDYRKAMQSFEQCIRNDRMNTNAYLFAAECCKALMNTNSIEANQFAEAAIQHYKKADKLNPDNPTIMLNLGLLHCRLNQCEKSTKYLTPIQDFFGFGPNEKASIQECLKKCN